MTDVSERTAEVLRKLWLSATPHDRALQEQRDADLQLLRAAGQLESVDRFYQRLHAGLDIASKPTDEQVDAAVARHAAAHRDAIADLHARADDVRRQGELQAEWMRASHACRRLAFHVAERAEGATVDGLKEAAVDAAHALEAHLLAQDGLAATLTKITADAWPQVEARIGELIDDELEKVRAGTELDGESPGNYFHHSVGCAINQPVWAQIRGQQLPKRVTR